MCGRYYVDDETAKEIEKMVHQVDERLRRMQEAGKGHTERDVCPTARASVIVGDANDNEQRFHLVEQTWGFPNFQGKSVIFNARSETVQSKPMFRESLQKRRCLIPATGFYEWNTHKDKYRIRDSKHRVLYMAGIYRPYAEEDRFVILTAQANESMARIHTRMPLVLDREELVPWIYEEQSVEFLLQKKPMELELEACGQLALRLDK